MPKKKLFSIISQSDKYSAITHEPRIFYPRTERDYFPICKNVIHVASTVSRKSLASSSKLIKCRIKTPQRISSLFPTLTSTVVIDIINPSNDIIVGRISWKTLAAPPPSYHRRCRCHRHCRQRRRRRLHLRRDRHSLKRSLRLVRLTSDSKRLRLCPLQGFFITDIWGKMRRLLAHRMKQLVVFSFCFGLGITQNNNNNSYSNNGE